jgi:hypothetical protein
VSIRVVSWIVARLSIDSHLHPHFKEACALDHLAVAVISLCQDFHENVLMKQSRSLKRSRTKGENL